MRNYYYASFVKYSPLAAFAGMIYNVSMKNHGLTKIPGLVDMHVHFRDPGQTQKEDIISGAAAAFAGGVTTVACMPNTKPVIDNLETLAYVLEKASKAQVRVLPYAAVTIGQKGETLTDFAALKKAGAIGFSDDGQPVMSEEIMRRALIAAKENGTFISAHEEDINLVRNYAVNDGRIAKLLGIPGRPAAAEESMIERDCALALETGGRLHIAHVSTAGSVEIIRKAKRGGAPVTCETCPQYFALTEDVVLKLGSLARINPPLRTESDRLAIIEGLKDGTIDAIASDHAPHTAEEKVRPLTDAPSGSIGLETLLSVTLTVLYHTGILTLDEIIKLTSTNPARILGIDPPDDYILVDLDEEWTVGEKPFLSRSQNSIFTGKILKGKAHVI